jgi:hypothetical protein
LQTELGNTEGEDVEECAELDVTPVIRETEVSDIQLQIREEQYEETKNARKDSSNSSFVANFVNGRDNS